MNFKTLSLVGISLLLASTSCIKEEGLDREADILLVTIEDKGYLTTIINENRREISLVMEGNIDHYQQGFIVPKISVSQRAKVLPKSLEPIHLNNFKYEYNVIAEDGGIKTYFLKIIPYNTLDQTFEEWHTERTGNYVFDEPSDPMWSTANNGLTIVYPINTPFPTRRSTDAYPESGGEYSVELETAKGVRNTVSDLMDIPVFAGSMFRGKFKLEMGDPITSTKFGQPHPRHLGKPLAITAYYKYKAGIPYLTWTKVDGKKVVTELYDKVDKPDIYAVLYKVPKGAGEDIFLTGKDIKDETSPMLVASAYMAEADKVERLEWTKLETRFKFYQDINFDEYDYKLAVVLGSSEEGAGYKGGVGSLLTVDDLRVICESDPDAYLYK